MINHLKMLKVFLLVAGISAAVFVIAAILHNVISALWGIEEPVFFFLALLAVVAFAVGAIGSLVIVIKGVFSKA